METEGNLEPQPGCSKDLREVSCSRDVIEDNSKFSADEHNYNNNYAGNSKNQQDNVIISTTQTMFDENINMDINSLPVFTIADDVIIEHIELEEGECAETMFQSTELAEGQCAETMFQSTNSIFFSDNDGQRNVSKMKKNSTMDKWNENEKQQFLTAVQTFGITDVEKIATQIPTKTIEDVNLAVTYFTAEAESRVSLTANHLNTRQRKNTKKRRREGNPLAEWLHMLNEKFTAEELQTVVGDAFRLIAECEYFPLPGETTNVNFRMLYHAIADALEGRPLPELSDESYEIIRRALTDVSLNVNQFNRKGFCDHIKNLTDIRAPLFSTLTEQEKKCPLKVRLANLMTKKEYNPFNIPFNLLDLDSVKNKVSEPEDNLDLCHKV